MYGLLERTKGMGLGKVKRDIAMLFIARCLDLYTKDKGKFAFLAPFTIYKTQAGAGFRRFLAKRCKVLKVHDLVTLYPFEGAVNRTSLIIIEKDKPTKFPVGCIMWHNPKTKGIDQDLELSEVKMITKQFDLNLIPIEKSNPMSPWMEITEKAYEALKKVIGSSPWYKAYEGVNTALNQVYWIEILSETPNGLLITNPSLPGQKKKVKQVKQVVEKDLVYPLIRGRDVKRWYVVGEYGWIIAPHDPETGKPIPENIMKIKYPKSYDYFNNFRNELKNRSLHKLWGKRNPFYSLYDIGDYTFYPYKVVWKYVAGKISGKAEFSTAVIEQVEDVLLGIKTVIPNEKLMLVPFSTKEEAYYVSAILNSSISQLLVASYVIETAISTHILEKIKIPKFDSSNSLHLKLSELSKKAHQLTKQIYEEGREDR